MALGLLIGYGSIGKRHGKLIGPRYDSIAIVDQSPESRKRVSIDHPDATVAGNLDALDRIGWEWGDSTGIIATWGPSHFEIFNELVDRGVKRILCEKPFANSVARCVAMLERSHVDGVTLGVHHQRRYSGLANGIKNIAQIHDLGDPVKVVIHGGAAGLVTRGVHWIDLTTELFEDEPAEVVSTASSDKLNPRSEMLGLFGGTAIWTHLGGQETVISVSNKSSIAPSTHIYYKNGVIDLADNLEVVTRGRDPITVAKFPAVTRTGSASETLFSGAMEGVVTAEAATSRILDELDAETLPSALAEHALVALSASIGALEAGKTGQKVELPIDPNSELGQQIWPIS